MGSPLSNRAGLSNAEAQARLRRDGLNVLPHPDQRRWPKIVADVLREPMLLLLIAASIIYVLIGDARDALLLGLSVTVVVGLTLYQEVRSERSLQALRDMSSPRARVCREGVISLIAACDVVVGDLIFVSEGDRVPADARLLTSNDLHLDESLLTGESLPIARSELLIDELRTIYAGSLVVRGNASAEVASTGVKTQMGKIGVSLQKQTSERTPLQREMRRVVGLFAIFSIASCIFITALYAASNGNILQALLAGITLAIANIPEEFPVVLTVFLALGAWRIARHQVLVRRPPAIEALGSITVLCTDKTGTLTENRMALETAITRATIFHGSSSAESASLLEYSTMACIPAGYDPIDKAIIEAAGKQITSILSAASLVRSYPVNAARLAYTNAWRVPDQEQLEVATKGAPESIARLCKLSNTDEQRLVDFVGSMAAQGLRVLAVASAYWPDNDSTPLPENIETFDFHCQGLLGFADPLRQGVVEAVSEAHDAGVRVVMMTGDHLDTARAIASAAGISTNTQAMLGQELDTSDEQQLADYAAHTDVFARVKPAHKLKLVEKLKQAGAVVAMTGDGINDAPALMAAHVGIAMGSRGTDVAREASSIVLLDDNFSSIVRAIKMGRTIYDNIQRAARYIIAVHVPITGLALLPVLLGKPLILLPLHVVFLELIIDPACSIALEREPAVSDVMRQPPRSINARLLNFSLLWGSFFRGFVAFVSVALIYAYCDALSLPTKQQAALSFTALVGSSIGLILIHRSGANLIEAIMQPNRVLWTVIIAALASIMTITSVLAVAEQFSFLPAPMYLSILSLLSPIVLLMFAEMLIRRAILAK
jgi:P-type Ca2+ transporter type 2C